MSLLKHGSMFADFITRSRQIEVWCLLKHVMVLHGNILRCSGVVLLTVFLLILHSLMVQNWFPKKMRIALVYVTSFLLFFFYFSSSSSSLSSSVFFSCSSSFSST